MKNYQRNNAKQRDHENSFIGLLDDLFDITNSTRTRESQQRVQFDHENEDDDDDRDYIPNDGLQ